jgi:hypothetical protein
MKIRGLRNICTVFLIIFVLFSSTSLVGAQPQEKSSRKGFIHLQFSITISWNANETEQPISPGETREVTLDVVYTVNKGLLGGLILRLLEGRSFSIQLSIEEKHEWCEAWVNPENMTGVVNPDIGIQNSSLFIHVNEEAPTNYTIGEIRIQCKIDNMKGPFKILTLIGGFEKICTLNFITGP